jgi:hypothetical protein
LRIIVDPDRGAPRKLHHDLELSDEQRATISRGNFGEYDLLYEIDGNIFGYYPSNLLAVLDDIARVLVNINNNQSHFITRAGYTILYARVFGDNIYLFDPLDESENWPKERSIALVSKNQLETQLLTVWSSLLGITVELR